LAHRTVQDIEAACDFSQSLDFSRSDLEGSELLLERKLYPFGFPLEVRTNSSDVLSIFDEMWGQFQKSFDREPIRVNVLVVETEFTECPPTPVYRLLKPILTGIADKDNYLLADLPVSRTKLVLSHAALRDPLYAKTYFIESAVTVHLATRYAVPVHAGFVALQGKGVLLCGDSGAGKSSLSYACARAGWTYVTDNRAFLANDGDSLVMSGNCYRVRFRPAAAELFPELDGMRTTSRAPGKSSIDLQTASMRDIVRTQTEEAHFMVFLNRFSGGPQELVPYRKDVARSFMQQELFGTEETLAGQYRIMERLLALDVLELRYTNLDWAIDRLRKLVEEGR
jgi:hypothetical protein